MRRIVCVGLDTFLVELVRRLAPDARVEEVDGGLDAVRRLRPDAVVAAGDHEVTAQLSRSPLGERTIAVIEAGPSKLPTDHAGPILTRPVGAEDLAFALAAVAPAARRERLRRAVGRWPEASSTNGLFAAARIAAAVAATALYYAVPDGMQVWAWVWLVLGVAVLRLWLRRMVPGLVTLDAVVALGAVVSSGSPQNPFLLFAVVAAAEVGYAVRAPASAVVLSASVVAGVAWQVPEVWAGGRTLSDVLLWGSLFPLGGLVGLMAWRIAHTQQPSSLERLSQLHRTLERLLREAQGVAGALETSTVAEEVLRAAEDDLDAKAGLLLVGVPPILGVEGAFGLLDGLPPRLVLDDRTDRIPPWLHAVLPSGRAVVARVASAGVTQGLLVLVVPEASSAKDAASRAQALADEAALALENVRLFQRVRELSVDRERQRLARDLHDGVVQSLVHVGFELDLLAATLPEDARNEIKSLRDTVATTVHEVRATVNNLRSIHLAAGLGPALHRLAADMQTTAGPEVTVLTDPLPVLAPEAELQLLRVAQEGLSNALQHAHATHVRLELRVTDGKVRLQVRDNGAGMYGTDTMAVPTRGVGMRAMHERARLLNGQLRVEPGIPTGTVVTLDVALDDVGA